MPTRNFAHRGARSIAPENTMLAIRKAWELGADGIEVDIRLTSDNIPVLHHDATLERTTDVTQKYPDRSFLPLSTFSFAELQSLDAGSWFLTKDPFGQIKKGTLTGEELTEMASARIPSLQEILRFIGNKKWLVNLELKKPRPPLAHGILVDTILTTMLEEKTDLRKIQISSFDHGLLRAVAARIPDIEIQALIGDNAFVKNDWGHFAFDVYNANSAYIDEKQYQEARQKGCRVNLYTVNDPADMVRYIQWGINAIITDYPQILSRQLSNSG